MKKTFIQNKLSLKKLQISRLDNLNAIKGGNNGDDTNGGDDDDGSGISITWTKTLGNPVSIIK
ncbi:hypothetical protein [Aquimarina spongiae]|uniref:Uncharacterized protein n=1 Tax=Aquimarina spongiae TaxID=570521 RepID=A0A1M6IF34_9FLAO|nr:hypothetical protein [Aquimarina spongiae]SHJ33049.1 hypothetical protein SAMN04488508_107316 [Aquimarina spongiae]